MRGYKPAGNFHDKKRLAEPLSHYFFVMTNGFGAMPDYSAQLTPSDRWAVAAYIRALQLSQNATQADVPAGVTVQNLSDITQQEGYPASFAEPWQPPATAVDAEPRDASQGMPGMAPAQDSDPAPWENQPEQPAGERQDSGAERREIGFRTIMAHGHNVKTLPADLSAPAFCEWLAQPRSGCGGDLHRSVGRARVSRGQRRP